MAPRDVRTGFGSLLLALLAACVPHLEPVEPIESDRPDETESTALVPAGMIQAEGGVTISRNGNVHETTSGETLIRIGLAPSLELRVEPLTLTTVSGQGIGSESGREDAAVGIKAPLYRRPEGSPALTPDLSLILATSLPTGTRSLRADGPEPEVKLAAQWELAPRIDAGANLTARRGREQGDSYRETGITTTLGLTLSDRLGSYIEWYGTRDQREAAARQVVNAGLTFRLTGDFQLDGRVGKVRGEEGGFAGIGMAARW